MFQGSIPAPLRAMVHEAARTWQLPEVHVGCSGNFTVERTLWDIGVRCHGNDVSIYTCALGALLAGTEQPLFVKPEYEAAWGWLQPYLDRGQMERCAVLMLGTRMLAGLNREHLYYQRMRDAYRMQWETVFEGTMASLQQMPVRLLSFYSGDVMPWLETVPKDGAVISFPPFWCLAPEERILTADLRWVPCGELREGDGILAFEEEPTVGQRCRRWQFGTITRSQRAVKQCVRVTLEDGSSVACTADHPWLATKYPAQGPSARQRWVRADQLLPETPYVVKLLEPWDEERSYEAGWLAGVMDGEGTLGVRSGARGGAMRLSIAQRPGAVANEAIRILEERGVDVHTRVKRNGVLDIDLNGGVPNKSATLGMLRPIRLLQSVEHCRLPILSGFPQGEPQIVVIPPAQFNELRSVYLNPGIAPASVLQAYGLLMGGQLVGCWAVTQQDNSRARAMAHELAPYAYLLSDFSVGDGSVPRLSALVLRAALSHEGKLLAERAIHGRVRGFVTTAFSKRPASMKYRGLFTLLSRKNVDGKYMLNYGALAGQWSLKEGVEAWLSQQSSSRRG